VQDDLATGCGERKGALAGGEGVILRAHGIEDG